MRVRVLDLFSGIGGFSLGLERAGMETIAFCEIEEYPRRVLKKHWPDVPVFEDVRKLRGEHVGSVDVICGGFPCQDLSVAGKQEGIDGGRSGLWSECARLLGEIQPKYAIFENVTNLLNGRRGAWFKRVLWDISQVGYDAEWHCIPASSVGAPHERDRVWIIAYADKDANDKNKIRARKKEKIQGERWPKRLPGMSFRASNRLLSNTNKTQCKRGRLSQRIQKEHANFGSKGGWEVEPRVDRVANGIPKQMDRLGCLGNAVVPQIPEIIGRAIMRVENEST